MGEYITLKRGSDFKIGTCEDLLYSTYQEFVKRMNENSFPNEKQAIKFIDGSYRFRFPFPDENHSKEFCNYENHNFDRGVLFNAPKNTLEICHAEMFFRTDNNNLPYCSKPLALGFRTPCIQTPEFPFKTFDWSNSKQYVIFEVVQQKPTFNEEGKFELATVVRCPYCGDKSRLSFEECINLLKVAQAHKKKGIFSESQRSIIALMIRGYRMKQPFPLSNSKEIPHSIPFQWATP